MKIFFNGNFWSTARPVASKSLVLLFLVLSICLVDAKPYPKAAQASWITDWGTASREAKRTGKPILLYVSGHSWCPYCKKLESHIFETPVFKEWAAKKVVLYNVDFSPRFEDVPKENNVWLDLRKKYKATIPGVVFLDPAGQQVGISYGDDDCDALEWTSRAEANMAPLTPEERKKYGR